MAMMMTKLPRGIALIGAPGSGKSTIANALCKQLGWERLSFAAALKDEVASILSYSDVAWLQSEDINEGTISHLFTEYRQAMDTPVVKERFRPLLQWWGTEYRRTQDQDYWVRKLAERALSGNVSGFVVDDCRYNNEAQALRLVGCKFILLESGETTVEVPQHASEVEWKSFPVDYTLSYVRGPEEQATRIVEFFRG